MGGRRQLTAVISLLLAVSALLLIAARPARTQTAAVLYSFGAQDGDGEYTQGGLASDGQGNFYGTTSNGGAFGMGTVFELSPNGSGSWNETVLYSFTGGADGRKPVYSNIILDPFGNLYGTTLWGGAYGYGVVFELSPPSWTETVLYSFAGGTDGANPENDLTLDSAGNLYGTTGHFEGGGTSATVFELSPSGNGWTKQVLYNFALSNYAGLSMDAAGNIFGATLTTVFELSPNGSGRWNPTVLHTFSPHNQSLHGTPVLDQAGRIYGTTLVGGAKHAGMVYRLRPAKRGWTAEILYSFKGGDQDGSKPYAGIVLDKAGNIYGTTSRGGAFDAGTVFALAAVSNGKYAEKVLWNFNGTDGLQPYARLILDSAGNLYSTTEWGGTNNDGVVFEVTP